MAVLTPSRTFPAFSWHISRVDAQSRTPRIADAAERGCHLFDCFLAARGEIGFEECLQRRGLEDGFGCGSSCSHLERKKRQLEE